MRVAFLTLLTPIIAKLSATIRLDSVGLDDD